MSVTCGKSVVFSWYSGFLHQWSWLRCYNWNIVESGVKHHNPNPDKFLCISYKDIWQDYIYTFMTISYCKDHGKVQVIYFMYIIQRYMTGLYIYLYDYQLLQGSWKGASYILKHTIYSQIRYITYNHIKTYDQFVCYIMVRTSYISMRRWWCLLCTRQTRLIGFL